MNNGENDFATSMENKEMREKGYGENEQLRTKKRENDTVVRIESEQMRG